MFEGYKQYNAIKSLLEIYKINLTNDDYQDFMTELASILRI